MFFFFLFPLQKILSYFLNDTYAVEHFGECSKHIGCCKQLIYLHTALKNTQKTHRRFSSNVSPVSNSRTAEHLKKAVGPNAAIESVLPQ